jgi:hypothetical protein
MAFSGQDEQIKCVECSYEFTFSIKDQEFYAKQGWADKPKRCKKCREARKARVASKE